MIQPRIPTVYLAGPDLFLPDANDRYATLDAVCAAHRLRAQRPFDGEAALHKATSRGGAAQRIFDGNMALLRAADAVLGNMMPFRGECEPDSGTVFEVGVAIALGKPVALYLPQGLVDSGERVRRLFGESAGRDGRYHALIEDFGLPLNLMLACAADCHASADEAVCALAARLAGQA